MTENFSPKILRHTIVLIIFLQSFNLFSQSDVYINVDWQRRSGRNKIELINSSNEIVISVSNGYYSDTNTSYLDQNSSTVSLSNGTYTVRVYNGKGKDWLGTPADATIYVDDVEVFTFDGQFSNTNNTSTEISLDYSLTINSLDDASFNYSTSGYCQIESDPTPTITGESGGVFSSTSGLIIDSSTGQIDVSASTLGSYVVTYTTTDPEQNSSTNDIIISDGDFATFEYSISKSTQSGTDLSPTITGVSGNYSSTSGLSINTSTGLVDVSDSTIGVYTVSYTTTGSCPKVYTNEVEILAAFPGVSQYYDSSKQYIQYVPGTMPVIISAPHGGTLSGSELPTRNCGSSEMDDNTDILIKEIQKNCYEQFGVYPYIIVNNLRRSKLDPNRTKSIATCGGNATTEAYFDAYHGFIDDASADITTKFGKGLYIDLHGQSHSIPRIEAGYNLSSSSFDEDLDNSVTNIDELARVTIKNLISNNLQDLTFEDLIRGAQSFGGLMQTTGGTEYAALGHAGCSRSVGYRTVPSHVQTGSDQGSCDDTNPGSNSYFAGDYYSNIVHGSGDTSNSNSVVGGGTANGGGGAIDGVMTEVNRRVRDLGSSYSSDYGRSDTKDATVPYFSRDYGKVIENYIELHYNDFSDFSYNSNSYSIYGLDVTPTVSGVSIGTFSSTSGLSINSSTGQIDVSDSTPGTYTIKHVAQNVGEYYKKEVTITINNSAVTNEFITDLGNWSNTSNWSLNRLPITNDNVSIPSGKIANLDLSNISVTDVSVEGTLNINSGNSITITGNLTTTGLTNVISNATSSGSIIVDGSSTGNITYERYIKDNSNWYLVSSPVENQDIDVFASASSLAISGSKRGLSSYNNVSEEWSYFVSGSTGSGNFDLGEGYSIRLTSAGNVSFTGNLKTDNVSKSVTVGSNGWNLIGNTYPSFISVNNSANITNNILDLSSNFSILESGFKAIYYWDTISNTYKPINNASDAKFLAPGQGYFVKVNANGNITLNENMQSHQSGDLFLKSNSDRFEIKLKINNGLSEKNTDIKYIEGTTIGLDEGYDAGLFNVSSTSLALYTYLVAANDETKYALQALPNNDFNSMVVPVGLTASIDSEITFKGEFKNIPNGINVYLEDKKENIFTRIDENNSSYKVVLDDNVNGIGRFYIHTTSETLSTNNLEITKLQLKIYQMNNNILRILNVDNDNSFFKLFSVSGKVVFTTKLINNSKQDIVLPKLSAGVYFSQIKSQTKNISKKIILE